MHKKIIIQIFEKAEKESALKTVTQLATHISETLEQHHNLQLNERTLRNYHNDVKNNRNEHSISPLILDALCQYLGYKNLKDYTLKTEKKSFKSRLLANKEKAVIGSLVVIASYFGIDSFEKSCMTWVDDHYEKEKCETENTIPIDNNLINNFKKISPDCDYTFFKEDGSTNLWYGKSVSGEYEYFTMLNKHPLTNKSLKEVTVYMIKTHICSTYASN